MKHHLSIILSATALLLCACSSESPEKCVEECWHDIDKGHYKKAVERFDIAPEEVAVFREMFAERGADVKAAKGVERVEILSSDIAADSATLEAAVTFGNGQRVTQSYRLVMKDKKWLMTW